MRKFLCPPAPSTGICPLVLEKTLCPSKQPFLEKPLPTIYLGRGVLCTSLQGARDDHRALVEFSVSAPTSFPIYISSFFFPNFYYLSTFNWGFVELDQLIIAWTGYNGEFVLGVAEAVSEGQGTFFIPCYEVLFFTCLSELFIDILFLISP